MTGALLSRRELAAQACALAGVREEVARLNLRHLLGPSSRPVLPQRGPTLQQLLEEVTTGETFFFRQPEHFQCLTPLLLDLARRGSVRAWSAGCSTGEEAYSVAAWALALVGHHATVEVLGTDVVESRLMAATSGVYGNWSMRCHEPCPWPVAERSAEGLCVLPSVRRVTRFQVHNLLAPPPSGGGFDLIFCRNVLIYLTPEAARRAVQNLLAALSPKGVLVFAPVDLAQPPAQLTPFGPPELSCYVRASEAPLQALVPPRTRSSVAPARPSEPGPPGQASALARVIEQHLGAITLAEAGRARAALRLLEELGGEAPRYLPALLLRALLRVRVGERIAGRQLATAVLQQLEGLDPDASIEGPVPLTVAYYRAAASALLEGGGKP